eukprot:607315-Prorocentrum_minimum.AAC.1
MKGKRLHRPCRQATDPSPLLCVMWMCRFCYELQPTRTTPTNTNQGSPLLEPPVTLCLPKDAPSHPTGQGDRQPLLPEGREGPTRPGGETSLHIQAVLPHSGTLPHESTRIRIRGQHAVVRQEKDQQPMRPDITILPPAVLLPSKESTPHRLPYGRPADPSARPSRLWRPIS